MSTPTTDRTATLIDRLNTWLDSRGRAEWIEAVGVCNNGLWIQITKVGSKPQAGICIHECGPYDVGWLGDHDLVRIIFLDEGVELADEAVDLSEASEIVMSLNLPAVLAVLLNYRNT